MTALLQHIITEGLTGKEASAVRERRIEEADKVAVRFGVKKVEEE